METKGMKKIFQSIGDLRPRQEELEYYFQSYPDVPREVIIKSDCLRLGFQFTSQALEICQNYQTKSYHARSFDRARFDEMGRKENLRAPQELKIKKGPYELLPTVIQCRISIDSPYLVDAQDGNLLLRANGAVLAEVEVHPKPKYYSLCLEDGRPYSNVVPIFNWGELAHCFVIRNCQYFGYKAECKFCGVNPNFKEQIKAKGNYTLYEKVEDVAKVMGAIFGSAAHAEASFILFTGGTIVQSFRGLNEEDFYLQYVEATRKRIGSQWKIGLQTAAKDKDTCKRMRDVGVDWFNGNIEVWDKELFKIICPGKERFVGWDEWVRRLVDAVSVFGEGNVGSFFVAGVEMAQPYGFKDVDSAVRSTTEGMDYLMSQGIVPIPCPWCVDPLSPLAEHPLIPLEYYVRLFRNWYEIWKKYHLPKPPGVHSMGPGQATFSLSPYLDMGS